MSGEQSIPAILDRTRIHMMSIYKDSPTLSKEQQYEDAVETIISLVVVNMINLEEDSRQKLNTILKTRDADYIYTAWNEFWFDLEKPEMCGGNTLVVFTIMNNLLGEFERNGNIDAAEKHLEEVHKALKQINELDEAFNMNFVRESKLND